jgi:hypothetical protein
VTRGEELELPGGSPDRHEERVELTGAEPTGRGLQAFIADFCEILHRESVDREDRERIGPGARVPRPERHALAAEVRDLPDSRGGGDDDVHGFGQQAAEGPERRDGASLGEGPSPANAIAATFDWIRA